VYEPVADPFVQQSTDLPVLRKPWRLPDVVQPTATTLTYVVQPAPFAQFAWPLPVVRVQYNTGWISQTPVNLGVPEPVVPPVEEITGTGPEKRFPEKRFDEDWEKERTKAARARYAPKAKQPETTEKAKPTPAQVVVSPTPAAPDAPALTPPAVSGAPQGLDSAQQIAENEQARDKLAEVAGALQITAALINEAIAENRARDARIAEQQAEEDAAVVAALIALLLEDDE
jgi:hypothetical protein